MQCNNCQDLLKQCIDQGFSLASISIVTQLSTSELQDILDGSAAQDNEKASYLMVFLMQLCYERPTTSTYYRNMLKALTDYFEVSLGTIAGYAQVGIDELVDFENSLNDEQIEKNIAHLFTTFVRDPRFSK